MQAFLMNFFLAHSSNPDIYYFNDFRCSFQDFCEKKRKPFSNPETNWLLYVSLNYPSPWTKIQAKSKAILMNNQGKFVTFFTVLHTSRVS